MIRSASSTTSVSEKALALMSDAEEGRAAPGKLGAWLMESPEHLSATMRLALPQEAAKEFSEETRQAMRSLLTPQARGVAAAGAEADARWSLQAADGAEASSQWRPRPAARPRRRLAASLTRPLIGGLAAALVVGFAFGLFLVSGNSWQNHETIVGQQRSVDLADGTRLMLNTGSRVEIKLSSRMREVRLIRGEARFEVISSPERPFLVQAGDVRVRTLGTQFDVYRASGGTYVAVSSGKVAVSVGSSMFSASMFSETHVEKGNGVLVGRDGSITPMSVSDFVNTTGWERGRMRFRDAELGRIAEEFNRYNTEPRIVVQGAAASQRFSGVFVARAPDSFVAVLSADPAYEVIKERRQTIVRLRSK